MWARVTRYQAEHCELPSVLHSILTYRFETQDGTICYKLRVRTLRVVSDSRVRDQHGTVQRQRVCTNFERWGKRSSPPQPAGLRDEREPLYEARVKHDDGLQLG